MLVHVVMLYSVLQRCLVSDYIYAPGKVPRRKPSHIPSPVEVLPRFYTSRRLLRHAA